MSESSGFLHVMLSEEVLMEKEGTPISISKGLGCMRDTPTSSTYLEALMVLFTCCQQ